MNPRGEGLDLEPEMKSRYLTLKINHENTLTCTAVHLLKKKNYINKSQEAWVQTFFFCWMDKKI
jgi:hypothetical protein